MPCFIRSMTHWLKLYHKYQPWPGRIPGRSRRRRMSAGTPSSKKTVQWMCRQIPMKHDKRLCALFFQKAGRAFVLGCPRDAPPIRYGCMASGRGSHLRLAPIRKGGSDCQAHGSGISSFQSAVILRGEDARTFLTDPCGDSLQSCSPAQAFLTFNLITQCHVRAFPDGRRCLCPPLLCMLYPETYAIFCLREERSAHHDLP